MFYFKDRTRFLFVVSIAVMYVALNLRRKRVSMPTPVSTVINDDQPQVSIASSLDEQIPQQEPSNPAFGRHVALALRGIVLASSYIAIATIASFVILILVLFLSTLLAFSNEFQSQDVTASAWLIVAILSVLSAFPLAASFALKAHGVSRKREWLGWVEASLQNLGSGMLGALLTFVLISAAFESLRARAAKIEEMGNPFQNWSFELGSSVVSLSSDQEEKLARQTALNLARAFCTPTTSAELDPEINGFENEFWSQMLSQSSDQFPDIAACIAERVAQKLNNPSNFDESLIPFQEWWKAPTPTAESRP